MNKPSLIKSLNLKKEMIPKTQLKVLITTSPLCNENFYMLILSILVTCFGLSLPSKTMLIGGMILNPLLGSLLSLAYSLSIHDATLIRNAAYNYLLGVLLFIGISTLYFAIIPDFPPNEDLLSMVQISYEDFMVSIVGGLTTAISLLFNAPKLPFVAISVATTLAPPVCIIGYGLSQSYPLLAWAAYRIFLINSLFIFLGCLVVFLFASSIQQKNS